MARGRNSKSEKEESAAGSLEVGMLCKSAFNDSELESYLRQGEIKASEKPPVPPPGVMGRRLYHCHFRKFQRINR